MTDALPPLDRNDHPDSQGWRWTDLEIEWIKNYAHAAIKAHMEALAKRGLVLCRAEPTPVPTVWQCRDYADGWITFIDPADAIEYHNETGATLRGLRDGTCYVELIATRPVRGYLGSTVYGGIDDHDEPATEHGLILCRAEPVAEFKIAPNGSIWLDTLGNKVPDLVGITLYAASKDDADADR